MGLEGIRVNVCCIMHFIANVYDYVYVLQFMIHIVLFFMGKYHNFIPLILCSLVA